MSDSPKDGGPIEYEDFDLDESPWGDTWEGEPPHEDPRFNGAVPPHPGDDALRPPLRAAFGSRG